MTTADLIWRLIETLLKEKENPENDNQNNIYNNKKNIKNNFF